MNATLQWFGTATWRLTVGDTVVWLDAYIDRNADTVARLFHPRPDDDLEKRAEDLSEAMDLLGREARVALTSSLNPIGAHVLSSAPPQGAAPLPATAATSPIRKSRATSRRLFIAHIRRREIFAAPPPLHQLPILRSHEQPAALVETSSTTVAE